MHASDIAAVGEPDFTADEVREALTGPHINPERDCWVALDPAGEIVGWAAGPAAGADAGPAKGRSTAGLGVDLANPTRAVRLYRAAGMHPLFAANVYQREI